ncbi:thiol-disulfide oxidoreductase [Actibacterium mucosum KCTC 23349]|uniref:Thiol-disulfide oxidoreductase n=1 Tax=Actibacterium mucosum KCTC 23349 TaxID=1454373 RepID=A0A037ZN01_9RHOB|nr:thiol-disulfide oxidoreductase [Actibacterium mucosum KCTC 23349]
MNRRNLLSLGAAGLATAAAMPALAQEAQNGVEVADMTLGNPDAPVTLIEYASFTCPHCARFHSDVMPQLKAEYVDTGMINFVYREVYFDRPGLWAAMLARCGGEMRYFAIADMIYEKQREWNVPSQGGAVIANNLRTIGRAAGLGEAEMEACLSDGDMAQAMVAHYEKNMAEYEIRGTPGLVINGTVHGNMSFEQLKEQLDAQLES